MGPLTGVAFVRMGERRGKGGDRGREEGQQGPLGKPVAAGLRRTPAPLTPEDQGERWAHLEGRWLRVTCQWQLISLWRRVSS